jgi:hypothetical protein
MMLLRWVVAVHGYLGVLAAASMLHPALSLRSGKPLSRRGHYAMLAATFLTLATYGGGLAVYGKYRELVKRPLFAESLRAGLLFETKEHLAVTVLCFVLGACVAALFAPRQAVALRKVSALLFVLAAVTAMAVVLLGTHVSSVRSF